MTPHSFAELVQLARAGAPEFATIPRNDCLAAARKFTETRRAVIRARHEEGESGGNVVRQLTAMVDELVHGAMDFALYQTRNRWAPLRNVALAALGGYGRAELSPGSDIDVALLHDGEVDADIERLNDYLMMFIWDTGFRVGYGFNSVDGAAQLAARDPEVFTTYSQARLIAGDTTTFARLRLRMGDMPSENVESLLRCIRARERVYEMPEGRRELYAREPDIKENIGGLRDYHAALWGFYLRYGPVALEDLQALGHLSPDDYLDLTGALDFLWRIRNELHFRTGREEDRLSYAMQTDIAIKFGYGGTSERAHERFVEDYFASSQRVRWFYLHAMRILHDEQMELDLFQRGGPSRSQYTVYRGQLCAASHDGKWFAENPARLMEIFWESTRRLAPLSYAATTWVADNLHFAGDAFRTSPVTRRYFLAICRRPNQAGGVFRQMAETGLLGAYLPEFGAVRGIVRYEDFHTYPVDEHTLRAVEALAAVPKMQGPIAGLLQKVLEHIRDPQILVLAVLLHDLGKVEGDVHTEAGVRIAREACARIGLEDDEAERVVFLVQHHMLMTNIAFYRDTSDPDTINQFASTLKTDERLRELLLMTYADLSAVGPEVWNEWKAALLLKLYLKAERVLLGRGEIAEIEDYWNLPKARAAEQCAGVEYAAQTIGFLQAMGERYFVSYSPETIAAHIACMNQARATGLCVRVDNQDGTRTSEITICARDRQGLFSQLAGAFAAQLIDIQTADLFTSADGWVVDCFAVRDAVNDRPITENEGMALEKVLRAVLLEDKPVQEYVDRARKRLFALAKIQGPLRARVEFDNNASATHTVIDIEASDRTGLLYDMASALAEAGADIFTSRIMTDAHRVRDSFYVRMDGQKLLERDARERVHAALLHAIDPRLDT